MRKIAAADFESFPDTQYRLGCFGDPSFGALRFSYASVSRRFTAAERVFLCRGALQEAESVIYLLHSRALCGGDMTDFRALPRDAGDGARCAAASPRRECPVPYAPPFAAE